jgi:hypothetical protein
MPLNSGLLRSRLRLQISAVHDAIDLQEAREEPDIIRHHRAELEAPRTIELQGLLEARTVVVEAF